MDSLFAEESTWATPIPPRFIRIHLGPAPIPPLFERWWQEFQVMHPGWDFMTLRDGELVPPNLLDVFKHCTSYSNQSDLLRYVALKRYGGVYIDTDVMPLKPFDDLLERSPFAGRRSSKAFEAAVIGCPAEHPAICELLERLPEHYWQHAESSLPISAAFLSSVWFGRPDVRHLPPSAFYPYNGFGAPKRDEKHQIFQARNFPPDMYAAHFSNHVWGGRPK